MTVWTHDKINTIREDEVEAVIENANIRQFFPEEFFKKKQEWESYKKEICDEASTLAFHFRDKVLERGIGDGIWECESLTYLMDEIASTIDPSLQYSGGWIDQHTEVTNFWESSNC